MVKNLDNVRTENTPKLILWLNLPRAVSAFPCEKRSLRPPQTINHCSNNLKKPTILRSIVQTNQSAEHQRSKLPFGLGR
jgi:hypothetical protein